jgi:acyl transferase domain-containing protein/acyl carrier protein
MTNGEAYTPAESVAIIGMKGRFPGARDLTQFWDNLRQGVESISRFSAEELTAAGVDPAMLKVPGFVPAGAVLDGIGLFDANFFGFNARDAEMMDPQQRLLLECAYECLEDAGYDSDTYPGFIGVFAGSDWSTYLYGIYASFDKLGYVDGMSLAVGNDKDHLTTHISYKLNLRGPSVAVQTACSTSLVAVCMACHSLLTYQSDIALAGGVAVSVPQKKGYFYQPGGIVSPDGHCRAFDAEGQGTVIGSGVGVVALKRLSEAIADGDHIYAVIKGSALNNDGSAKVGYTAPSIEGQAQVIAMAQAAAGVDPATISYVEAHGTATALGDPIEVSALTQAFRLRTSLTGFCGIGSLKSNVGHLSSAAGVGALIKTVLSLQNRELPPTLHFASANPQIDFASSPFYVNARLAPWTTNGGPRRAAVSSFGIGGTNAHAIVEEAPVVKPSGPSRSVQLLTISAKTVSALERATDDLAAALERDPNLELADVAHTLHVGRRGFSHRRVLVTSGSTREAAAALRERRLLTAAEPREHLLVFMFPGQGAQYVDMGRELYQSEPTFREQFDRCCEILRPLLGRDLRDVCYPKSAGTDAAQELKQTSLTQPALFTIQYALASLWVEWGMVPGAMIGHSIGEYTAACLADVFSLEDALALVALRGSLMGRMRPGSMLAVPLSETDVQPFLSEAISLGSVNGPRQCVLSGPTEPIAALARQFEARGTPATLLHTSHAFHSAMMEPVLKPFAKHVQAVTRRPPKIPFISCLTGTWITAEAAVDPSYWAAQLRQTVRFGDGLQTLMQVPDFTALEVGPGLTLSTLAQLQPKRQGQQLFLPSLHAAHDQQSDTRLMLTSLARLWLGGTSVSWPGFARHERRRRVSLPTYPFEREHYWLGPSEESAPAAATESPPKSRDIADWFYVPAWTAATMSEARPSSNGNQGRLRWLVVGHGGGLGQRLVERLGARQHDVTFATFGDKFTRIGPSSYTLAAGSRVDYEALFNELRADGQLPEKVVHLGSVGELADGPDSLPSFERWQALGCHNLLWLAQALERQNITQRIEVGVVSTGLHAVLGDEPLSPAKATLLGPCKVIPQEYSNLTFRSIDLLAEDLDGTGRDRIIDRLIDDLTVEPFESAVAHRKGRRWVQRFEPVRLTPSTETTPRLRRRGVYLITGGLGNIGLALAECLARAVQARLVLTGRSALPPREQWSTWLTAHPSDAASAKIRGVLRIEEMGGEVLVVQADASSREQMRAALARASERFGALHGIIHGAGNTSAQGFFPVNQADEAAGRAHFAPKAAGLMMLEELIRGRPLDFCLLLSSLSAVLGGLGLVAYAGANAFMDAFAIQQNQNAGFPWITVNWDAWIFPEPGDGAQPSAGTWSDAILPAEGSEAFLRIVHHAPGQVVVSTSNLHERLDKWIALRSLREAPRAAATGSLHARPSLSTQFMPPRTPTEEGIADVWQLLLGVGPIGVFDKFFELGGHSLLAIQVVSRLREVFGIELPVQRLFEAPTVAQLAEAIDRDLAAVPAPGHADERLAEMVSFVEGLSDEEVAAMLADEVQRSRGIAS